MMLTTYTYVQSKLDNIIKNELLYDNQFSDFTSRINGYMKQPWNITKIEVKVQIKFV